VSAPPLPAARAKVLAEIAAERLRQEEKWGECDYPSVDPEFAAMPRAMCSVYGVLSEEVAKQRTDDADQRGACTFAHVAVEELAEALSAPDELARREELVQLGAVVVKWLGAIDRRAAKGDAPESALSELPAFDDPRQPDALADALAEVLP
jgi:hypothetical protein